MANSQASGARFIEILSILKKHKIQKGMDPVKFREILEDLGPTFVKIGQIMSTRQDMFSQRYTVELEKLRSSVKPMPFEEVESVLVQAFGDNWRSIFVNFDTTPLGSASIAQVHRATLNTGQEVVVKVQRPNIYETMKRDIRLVRKAAKFLNLSDIISSVVDLDMVLDEFWATSQEEMDFTIEARFAKRFKETYKDDKTVDAPLIYDEYTSKYVLVMEYVDGLDVNQLDLLESHGYDPSKIAHDLACNYISQIIENGFFHADPHAGNIILKDGIVYFIDLGMVGRMSSHDRGIVKDMIFAVAEGDVPKLKDSLMRFAVTRGDSAELDHSAFLSDLDFIVADFAGLDLKDLDIGEFLTSLLNLARKNDVELPSVVTMFARGMVTLEGLLTEYMPNVNMIQIIQTHIKNEKSTYARVRDMGSDLAASSYRAAKGSLEAAEYLGLASRMLTRGQLKVNTQIMSSDKALRQLGGIIDRMSMAIVIAGLFIGSSVVYYARIEPVVFGIPVIGFMGYVSALVLALMLGREIWRNSHGGKH